MRNMLYFSDPGLFAMSTVVLVDSVLQTFFLQKETWSLLHSEHTDPSSDSLSSPWTRNSVAGTLEAEAKQ